MCGIVGIVVKANNGFIKSTEDTFYQMLYADALRGDDSTGIVFIEKDSSFGIMKEACTAGYVLDAMSTSKQGKAMWSFGKAMIGHNRKKTSGAINEANAHPFVVDDTFAMVHNGTLYSHKHLADTEVDSEALAIHLSKHLSDKFNKEAFEEAMGKVHGAFAIAAYHQTAHKVFLTRNSERPLAYIETPEAWIWASEAAMLWWIASRNNITLKDVKVNFLKPHELVTIDLDNNELVSLDYVPKKAQVPTYTNQSIPRIGGSAQPTNGLKVPTTVIDNGLSKNAFKRIKTRWMQATVSFFVDDYLEKAFPRTLADGETLITLMGKNEQFSCDHEIVAEFDITSLEKPSDSIAGGLYTGKITDMIYYANKRTMLVIVSGAMPVKKSLVIDDKYIQRKLDEQEDKLVLH